MAYTSIGLAYLILYAVGGWALSGHPLALALFGNSGLVLPPLAVSVIVFIRRREWVGCQRLFWDVLAIGMALWVVGHLGWAFGEIVLKQPSWLQWHTLFSLCGGTCPLIALLARPHLGTRSEAAPTVSVDLASYGLLAGFIYTYFVMIPVVVPGSAPVQDTLLTLAQTNRLLLLLGTVGAAWIARDTPWGRTYIRLALGAGFGFVGRFAVNIAIERGEYQSGSLYDLTWIAPALCYAWAAITAPPSSREDQPIEMPAPAAPVLLAAVPVFLIPLIGYGWLFARPADPTGDSVRMLVSSLLSRSELTSLSFTDLMERGFEKLGLHISAAAAEHGVWRGTIVRRRRDGSTFPVSCTVVPLKDADERITYFVGVERDITDELRLRDQLVQSERLSAMGEVVAGVAHEINNPLQTIVGCVELMMDSPTDPSTRRDLELLGREAARAGQIVRNLLSFVRRSTPNRVAADLNEIVKTVVELRRYHLQQRDIIVLLRSHQTPLPVLVNRDEVQQVIMNLLLNAEHAINGDSGRGTITISTFAAATGQQVLQLEDDGPGIPTEVRGRIFEPFFTTKEVGEGTGLGLSISHGIAAAHGGSLELCGDGPGACFRLTLPAHAGAQASIDQRIDRSTDQLTR
ncbi:MAG: PAS domain-containing protein [Acidobacteria bacterium]|nr:PAS domain-containing protein [Acidobacteriota bacterium]